MPVPKRGVIASVIIGIAAQDIKSQPAKQLLEGFSRLRKPMPDDFGKLFIAGVTRRHLTEAEQGQGGNHRFSRPPGIERNAVEALNQQHVLTSRLDQPDGSGLQPGYGSQSHGKIFGLDDVVEITAGRKFRNILGASIFDQGLRASTANGAAMEERLVQPGG